MLQIVVARERVQGRFLATWSLALLGLLLRGGLVMAASSPEEALRARAEQCYSALQQGDWSRVEKYLTPDSKRIFRSQTKTRLMGYKIESVKIEPDGRTATVVVQVPIMSSVAPRPIAVPTTSRWRLVKHIWYMEAPRSNPNAQQWLLDMAPKTPRSPPAFVFSRDLKFESTWCGLGNVASNAAEVARFRFKNVSTHVVKLAEVQLGCDCLTLKTQPKEYQPGESGTLEIEFDASKLGLSSEQSFMQDIVFKTEPGGGYVKLTVAALVLAPSPAPPVQP